MVSRLLTSFVDGGQSGAWQLCWPGICVNSGSEFTPIRTTRMRMNVSSLTRRWREPRRRVSENEGADLIGREDAIDAFGAEVDEGRGVEKFGVEEAAFGDVVDDHIQEFDLVGVWGAAGEELVEGGLGDGAVEADEGAEEEA
jgi:hypothetical protein